MTLDHGDHRRGQVTLGLVEFLGDTQAGGSLLVVQEAIHPRLVVLCRKKVGKRGEEFFFGRFVQIVVAPHVTDQRFCLGLAPGCPQGSADHQRGSVGLWCLTVQSGQEFLVRPLLPSQGLFEAEANKGGARPVLEPRSDLDNSFGRHFVVAAGDDQPVDQIGTDSVAQGVGGDRGSGRIALPDKFDGELEPDRIERVADLAIRLSDFRVVVGSIARGVLISDQGADRVGRAPRIRPWDRHGLGDHDLSLDRGFIGLGRAGEGRCRC